MFVGCRMAAWTSLAQVMLIRLRQATAVAIVTRTTTPPPFKGLYFEATLGSDDLML